MNISLLAALVLASVFLAKFWVSQTQQSESIQVANTPASCSTCDARHRNLEQRSEIMRMLKEQK